MAPDPTASNTVKDFTKNISINQNMMVKAQAVKTGWKSSAVVEKYYQRSAIKPDTFFLKTFPDRLHKGLGVSTLFDLMEGSTDILYASDGNWLGYRNQDFVVEMAFKKPTLIKEVALSTLSSVALESFPPSEVELWVSVDGSSFSLAGKIKPVLPGEKAPIGREMIHCPIKSDRPVSRIKIIAKPLMKLPVWNKSAGNPAWFFY